SGTLQGTTNVTASDGVVTYANLAHNVATNITILFSSGSLVSTTSTTIAVSAASASALAFTVQPGGATAGPPFGSQPVLSSQHAFGNTSASALASHVTVTLTLTSGTGQLLGTATADIGTAAGNGTASFSGLEIDAAGSGKQLTASAGGLSDGLSSTF